MNSRSLEVVHLVESFATGVYDIVVSLATELPDVHQTVAYWRRPETPEHPERDFPAGVTLVELAPSDGRFGLSREMRGAIQAYRFLRTTSADAVIHLHSTKAGIWGRMALALLRRRRQVVYTPHAAAFLRHDIGRVLPAAVVIMERVLGMLVRTRIVCCSPSEANEYRQRGMTAEYVWNGIPASPRPTAKPNTHSHDGITVAGMGRISPQKGAAFFGGVAKKLASSGMRFKWIGDGPEKTLLPGTVEITGWISREEALVALDDVDIFLSTSEWEGLSMAVLQALESGTPVLLRNCVGNVDVADLLPSKPLFSTQEECVDMLLSLARDPALLGREGVASKDVFDRYFACAAMCKEYERIYRSDKR